MAETYDVAIVPAGESLSYPRSKEALRNIDKVGLVLVTGGWGGFAEEPFYKSDGEISFDYLRKQMRHPEKLYLDDRSLETVGNFAFPAAYPILGNPNLAEDVKSVLIVTDQAHMKRALPWAHKVLPANIKSIGYAFSDGPKKEDLKTKVYNTALARALRKIPDQEPEMFIDSLNEKHPFYEEDWFNKPANRRQLELALRCIKWYVS